MLKNQSIFWAQMLRNPSHVGAIAPSSRGLGRSMSAGLVPDDGTVIEIGPGTGAITREILRQGIAEQNLHLFEMNAEFCTILENRFPAAVVHNKMAQEMTGLGLDNVSAVLSGLPLLNMPADVQLDIVTSVFETLRPGGKMVQFTYGPKPPIIASVREALGLRWEVRKKIWLNLPPARVYVFSK